MKVCQENPNLVKLGPISVTLHRDLVYLYCLQQYRIFCRSTAVWREPISTCTWQHSLVLYCWQCQVAQQ